MRLLLLVLLLVVSSCAPSDLGASCVVVSSGGDPVSWRRLPAGAVLSGAVECEHEVCLVNPDAPRAMTDAPATGYCSRPCASDADCAGPEGGRCGQSDPAGSPRHCWFPGAGIQAD